MDKLLTVGACVGTWWGNEGYTSRAGQNTSLNHNTRLIMQTGCLSAIIIRSDSSTDCP